MDMLLLLFVLFLTIPSPIATEMKTKTEQSSKWENHIILHSHFPLESLGKMDNSIKEDNAPTSHTIIKDYVTSRNVAAPQSPSSYYKDSHNEQPQTPIPTDLVIPDNNSSPDPKTIKGITLSGPMQKSAKVVGYRGVALVLGQREDTKNIITTRNKTIHNAKEDPSANSHGVEYKKRIKDNKVAFGNSRVMPHPLSSVHEADVEKRKPPAKCRNQSETSAPRVHSDVVGVSNSDSTSAKSQSLDFMTAFVSGSTIVMDDPDSPLTVKAFTENIKDIHNQANIRGVPGNNLNQRRHPRDDSISTNSTVTGVISTNSNGTNFDENIVPRSPQQPLLIGDGARINKSSSDLNSRRRLNYISDRKPYFEKHHHNNDKHGPHFEDIKNDGNVTNMTVQTGQSVYFNCRISLLQDKTVSWMRRLVGENELQLLTVGNHTYSGDSRYAVHYQYPNNWRLKITKAQVDDEGTYECQLSTHPPRVIQYNLHVYAPQVMIIDDTGLPLQDKYYEVDSTIQLSCIVRDVKMETPVVYWSHNGQILNHDTTRGGISVKTNLIGIGANSTILVAKVNNTDSGKYSCSISRDQFSTISVHVLSGESYAELHHGNGPTIHKSFSNSILSLFVFLFFLLHVLINNSQGWHQQKSEKSVIF